MNLLLVRGFSGTSEGCFAVWKEGRLAAGRTNGFPPRPRRWMTRLFAAWLAAGKLFARRFRG